MIEALIILGGFLVFGGLYLRWLFSSAGRAHAATHGRTEHASRGRGRKQEQRESRFPVLRNFSAELPLTCDCGHTHNVNVVGLTPRTQIDCPGCGDWHDLTEEQMDAVEAEFAAVIRSEFQRQGFGDPGDAAIARLRMTGELVQATGGKTRSTGIVEHPVMALSDGPHLQPVIAMLSAGQELTIGPHPDRPGQLAARTAEGLLVGRITDKRALAKAVAEGHEVLHASVDRISTPKAATPYHRAMLRAVTGPPGSVWNGSMSGNSVSKRPLRPYAVSIVGERSYQDQIAAVGEGEAVVLFHEPDNPYDDRAVAVVCHGDTLGYLPRGSWLGAALLDEGKGYSAHIKRLSRGSEGVTGVTLEVVLDGEPVGTRDFVPA